MALANPSTTPEKLEDPARRRLLLAAPAIGAAIIATQVAPEPAPAEGTEDIPFLMAIEGEPGLIALCLPARAQDIRHAYTFVLNNGRMILAERLDRLHCDDGDGWREAAPGEFDGRIIGRVVTTLAKANGSWSEVGFGFMPKLAGRMAG